ncbi:MAG: hypothetical protein IPK82_13625 [Polyangiaceae bacterium]|nr:hypothetical protein [Polyangiaceae bacterium]
MATAATVKTTTRELRAHLREMLAHAARGKEVIVTLRGKAYVKISSVPDDEPQGKAARGDAPAAKKAPKAAKKKKKA